MLTQNEVEKIIEKLSLRKAMMPDYDLSEDISCIVYRADVFDCGRGNIISRHIDIEFTFGDYYELHDGDDLYQYICSLCNLQILAGGEEIILYQK